MPLKNPLLVKLGIRLKTIRTKLGLSQEDFAKKLGFHRTYMGALERGEKNMSLLTVHQITTALNIDMSDLLEGLFLV